MKEVKLTLEEARELYKSDLPIAKDLALKAYTEDELKNVLPKSWGEITSKKITGFYVDSRSEIDKNDVLCDYDKSLFRTEEQAKASIAMAQLSQLMYIYNEGWEPDWSDEGTIKHIISYREECIYMINSTVNRIFLAFKTRKLRDKFAENFKDLIEQAKPLL